MGKIVFIILIILFNGCSTKTTIHPVKKIKLSKKIPSKQPKYKPKNKNYITTALYKEYKKWYKTPYKYGGCNLKGLDCSSLVQQIYKDAFGITIPRTTKNQVKMGYRVKKNSTKAGDIVFFKINHKGRHVGIIMEKDSFIHASTKYGVTISHLNNPYWKSKYWQSRRILP